MKLEFLKHIMGVILLLALWPVSAAEFKHQISLTVNDDANAFVFDLPAAVYQNAYYPDLRDIRVFNVQADQVPMRLVLQHDEVKQTFSASTLPIFSLNQTLQIPISTKQVKTSWSGDQQSYSVSTSNSVRNYVQNKEAVSLNTLLIDASVIKGKKALALQLKWSFASAGNRVFYVALQGSHDLANWQPVTNRHKLIELNTGERVVLENRIPLQGSSYDYYQLRFLNQPIPEIQEVKAVMVNQAITQPIQWTELDSWQLRQTENADYVVEWDTGGYFPVEGLRLGFDYRNLMADVQLYARPSKEAHWQRVANGSVYDIGDGDMAMFNNQLDFNPQRHRYWRLVSRSEISSQWINQISFAWRQQQLQFLAQGDGPYVLKLGSQDTKSKASNQWYKRLPQDMRQSMFSNAVTLGAMQQPLQEIKIEKPPGFNYSRWLFWGLLVIVLSLLLTMATKLLKEVGDDE
ncbi:MAG: DUF3999 family protein [Proteobacteria bacterium]|nr:MAG: DUF3999 family protein [Pseudomonadota bacterium]